MATRTKKPSVKSTSKKTASRAPKSKAGSKASAKKPSPRTAPKTKPAAKNAGSGAKRTTSVMIEPKLKMGGPFPVEHGAGQSLPMIAQAVVDHLNSGAGDDAPLWDKFWSSDFVSIEGIGTAMAWNGRAAVHEKCQGWMDQNEVLGCRATGPFLGATGFAVLIDMDVREKASGKRFRMSEVGVYTVRGDRIVREEFMYGSRDEVAE